MIKKLLSHNTVQFRHSLLYYVGNFALNFFRYLFHLTLLRFLSPPEYGEFLSYLSLMYILAIPTGTIGSLVTKYISDFKGKEDAASINSFFYYLLKKTAPIGLVVGLLLIIFSSPLATLFKAHHLAFIVLGISTLISLFQTIVSSYLLGFQKFITQTVLGFAGVFATILLAIFFIKLGMGATGAVLGQIVSGLLITLLTLYFIKDSIYPMAKVRAKSHFSLKNFTFYSFIFSLGSMSLMSADILVVRVLFDPHTSGLYSSLSILGRMIFFGLSPIISLVLPMVSLRHSRGTSTKSIFLKLAFSLLCLGSLGILVFTFLPKTIITLLSGSQYLSVAPFLSTFAITMVLFALSQFVLVYLMATGREKSNLIYLGVTLVQPLILYFYAHSLPSVVSINFRLHSILFISLLIYLLYPQLTKLKFTHDTKAR